ncbi:MAG: hypothetical protein ACD_51C00321G0002, partial [uncultured bacterium]
SECCEAKIVYVKDWGNHHDECSKCRREISMEEFEQSKEKTKPMIYCSHINNGKNDCTCPLFHYYGDSSEETQDNV